MSVIKGWKFPVQVDKNTGKIMTITDNENVKQSVNIILKTQIFERKIIPEFGTNMRSFMFEIVNPNFVSDMRRTIETSIKKWEEHIRDINVSVRTSQDDASVVITDIDYITDISPMQEKHVEIIKTKD